MFTLRCPVHALDLVVKQVEGLDFFRSAVDKAARVTQLIVSHSPHAIFQEMALLRISKPGVRKQAFLFGCTVCLDTSTTSIVLTTG